MSPNPIYPHFRLFLSLPDLGLNISTTRRSWTVGEGGGQVAFASLKSPEKR